MVDGVPGADAEIQFALRRLAESERRAVWWRSQGETDAADRYAAEARALREAVRELGSGGRVT